MIAKRVGIIGFNGVVGIDLLGPAQVFAGAEIRDGRTDPKPGYDVLTVGLTDLPFTTDSGVIIKPQKTVKNAPQLDTLIIPGGRPLRFRESPIAGFVSAFVKARAGNTRRIVSICTGAFSLAQAGLLGGRNVTTHWRFAGDLARCFPNLSVQENAIFLKSGSFYTSAGATAGIDLSLHLVEEDYGASVALAIARDLVVYFKRAGGQEQYSEPLRFQTESIDRFSELTTWMMSHLEEDLSVEALAARACLCPRHFGRRFKSAFGQSPANFVEKLRLDEARRRLSASANSVENIGLSVGFKNSDAFRRAFQRRLGVNPTTYRHRFGLPASCNGNKLSLGHVSIGAP